MRVNAVVVAAIGALLLLSGAALAQEDAKDCKDHPLFTRISNYYLQGCEGRAFDSTDFEDPQTKESIRVEGHMFVLNYRAKKGFEEATSELQVARNYSAAIKAIGGNAYEASKYATYMTLFRADKETWAKLTIYGGATSYDLTVVEREPMKQEVVADAKLMSEGINSVGHVAIYGIYFDTDKAVIKPESEPALAEMAKLIKDNPSLNVFIVGHTDNTGTFEHNMKLSLDRATAVVNALVGGHGIAAARLKPYGVASLAPVASNATEDGKAKNRRVELVER